MLSSTDETRKLSAACVKVWLVKELLVGTLDMCAVSNKHANITGLDIL